MSREKPEHIVLGFSVKAGKMSSLGSAGATFITPGHPLWEEAQAYRSERGIGRSYREQVQPDPPTESHD